MKNAAFLFILLGGFFLSENLQAYNFHAEEEEVLGRSYYCDQEFQQGIKFNYCIRDVDRQNTRDIVYYFHGLGGKADDWFRSLLLTVPIQINWHLKNYDPIVITVSFGPEWALIDNRRFKLRSYFKKVVIPTLEKKVGGLKDGERKLIGLSMGGFNALQVALKEPQLFTHVALLCPAISTLGPYDSKAEVKAYIRRTWAFPHLVDRMLRTSRKLFVDEQDWRDHDPLRLIKSYHPKKKPKFFMSIGLRDSFGFQEGSKKFQKLSKSKGSSIPLTWVPVPGPHCVFNGKAAADFVRGD